MKTTVSILLALGAAFAMTTVTAGETGSCCAAKTAALSPRAQINQTSVVCGTAAGEAARADLGTGARAKAFGGGTANLAGTATKDVGPVPGRDLGVAAKEKASGTIASPVTQIAPLK